MKTYAMIYIDFDDDDHGGEYFECYQFTEDETIACDAAFEYFLHLYENEATVSMIMYRDYIHEG